MKHQATIEIKPSIMKWAIESSGWPLPELAQKLGVNERTFREWEEGDRKIPIKKLEKLADHIKRPLAVFFLAEPPQEIKIPDYRKISGIETEPLLKDTRFVIRKAGYFQSVAKEMLLDLGFKVETPIAGTAKIENNPQQIATRERKRLHIDELMKTDHFESLTQVGYLTELRKSIESQNILVFQMKMPMKDARGFSLSDAYPCSIVINSSDAPSARLFTLMHEYAHIILKENGICLTRAETMGEAENIRNKVEKWCNSFAASVLLPEKLLQEEFVKENANEASQILSTLSKYFKVSKHAILIQIYNLNLINADTYKKELEIILEKEKEDKKKKEKKKKGGGFIGPVERCISERGNRFISLVLDSQRKGVIHYGDVMDYLGINLKHMENLEAKL